MTGKETSELRAKIETLEKQLAKRTAEVTKLMARVTELRTSKAELEERVSELVGSCACRVLETDRLVIV